MTSFACRTGTALLETSLLNKESAFSEEERRVFNLEGLLPQAIETIEQQVARAYQQFSQFNKDLDKHIYLRNIQDTNETLYFRLIIDYLSEMMPIIYTPTVGLACQLFSEIYRRKRGVFISYPEQDRIEQILQNVTKQKVKIIVVTDSERILGLGDQGIGGMGIPIGKLALYSACGGISPAYTLPVTLDVGTNNQQLLDDPMYMGWRHKRIIGDDYYDFVDKFISQIKRRWPKAMIQFEDFAQVNATPLLQKYRHSICAFNDDIQGTAAVTVGTLLAACIGQQTVLKDHHVIFVGAGSAGCGIAEQIIAHMQEQGLNEEQALRRIFLTNSQGLLTDKTTNLKSFQQKFIKPMSEVNSWASESDRIDLLAVVRAVKPSIIRASSISQRPTQVNIVAHSIIAAAV
jgi:malate dehydrogenase (oxaloacetate-decarboxylating)